MRLVKTLLAVFVLIVVVFALAIVSLILLVNPNKMKPVIVDEVRKQTGYELTINGDLSWSFYPTFGVQAEQIILSESKQKPPFLELQGVTIATKFWQIVRGKENLAGDIYAKNLSLANMHIQQAHVGVHWQNAILVLEPLTAFVYDGNLTGKASGSELSTMPKWNWDITISHAQLKPWLEDLNGANNKLEISGTADVDMQATSQGKSKPEILQNLNGVAKIRIANGAVYGTDLNYLVQSADALLSKQAVMMPNTNKTVFDSLTGTANIKNGVAEMNDLLLVSPAFTTNGNGKIDLINQTLDYNLRVTPTHTIKLKGTVPVLVQGDLHNPTVRLDMLVLRAMITGQEIEKVKTKVQEEIKKLPGKANQIIQNLFGK